MLHELPPFAIHTFEDSPLVKNNFREYVDTTRLRQLLNVGYDKPYDAAFVSRTGSPFDTVQTHLDHIADNVQDGELVVSYKAPKRVKCDQGRVFAAHSLSQFCLPKEIRGYLLQGNGVEHDMQNCHATLLYDEAKRG